MLESRKLSIIDSVLKESMAFPTQKALEKYLREHPKSDKSQHWVEKTKTSPNLETFAPAVSTL